MGNTTRAPQVFFRNRSEHSLVLQVFALPTSEHQKHKNLNATLGCLVLQASVLPTGEHHKPQTQDVTHGCLHRPGESTIVQVLAMPSERMPRTVACTLQDTALCSKCLHRPPASTTIQKIKLPHMVACTMRATMRGVLVSGFVVPPGGQCKHLHRKTVL